MTLPRWGKSRPRFAVLVAAAVALAALGLAGCKQPSGPALPPVPPDAVDSSASASGTSNAGTSNAGTSNAGNGGASADTALSKQTLEAANKAAKEALNARSGIATLKKDFKQDVNALREAQQRAQIGTVLACVLGVVTVVLLVANRLPPKWPRHKNNSASPIPVADDQRFKDLHTAIDRLDATLSVIKAQLAQPAVNTTSVTGGDPLPFDPKLNNKLDDVQRKVSEQISALERRLGSQISGMAESFGQPVTDSPAGERRVLSYPEMQKIADILAKQLFPKQTEATKGRGTTDAVGELRLQMESLEHRLSAVGGRLEQAIEEVQGSLSKLEDSTSLASLTAPDAEAFLAALENSATWKAMIAETIAEAAWTVAEQREHRSEESEESHPQERQSPVPYQPEPAESGETNVAQGWNESLTGDWQTDWQHLNAKLGEALSTEDPRRYPTLHEDAKLLNFAIELLLTNWPQIERDLREHDSVQLKQYLKYLDEALYAPFAERLATPRQGGKAAKRYGDLLLQIAELARQAQEARKAEMRAAGLVRIEAEPGTPRITSPEWGYDVEGSRTTSERDKHDRLIEIRPGNGGYRYGDEIIRPSVAAYWHHTPEASEG